MIQLGNVDLVKFAQAAYALSKPQGMGRMHYIPGELQEWDARELVRQEGDCVLSMDYVHGRACKMNVFRNATGGLEIREAWYDHTDAQLAELLGRFGIPVPVKAEHSMSCECDDCKKSRR
jgi:hypothetical protein